MSQDNTALYVIGGLGLLYLFYKMSPTTIALQNQALESQAALQSQQISAAQNEANIQTGASLATSLANDFSM